MVITILNAIIDQINAFPIDAIIFYGRIIGGSLSIILLVTIIVVGKKFDELDKKNISEFAPEGKGSSPVIHTAHKDASAKAWENVLLKIHSTNSSDWLLAVIEADSIVDDILKRMGLQGETMAERLQQLDSSKLASLQDVWDAHKIRNRVAHSPASMLRGGELAGAIEKYKKALKELGYLE